MPTIAFFLMLVVIPAGGEEKRTELAGPFTNISACAIMGGILAQRGFSVKIPEDVSTAAYMTCERRWHFSG